MLPFAAGEADVLVATTVIEVGIDVPNATVMLVEGAERYGISQLHQLRGRVGRGEHAATCLLFGPKDAARLRALERHTDGFELAQIDLELRGEGELAGTRQSGLAQFRVARLPEDERAGRGGQGVRRGAAGRRPRARRARARAAGRRAGRGLRGGRARAAAGVRVVARAACRSCRARRRIFATTRRGGHDPPAPRPDPLPQCRSSHARASRRPRSCHARARARRARPIPRPQPMRVVAGLYGGRRLDGPTGRRDPPDERPRARGAVQRPRRRRSRARACSTSSPARARWASRRSRAAPPRPSSSTARTRRVTAIRANLAALGIDAEVRPIEARAALRAASAPARGIRSGLPRSPLPASRRAGAGAVGGVDRGARTRRPRRHRERPPRPAGARPATGRRAPLRRHPHPHP